ncbi:hypothetical protein CU044_4025 [Streptomyces sp. L-9-10]|nr:hypothetical protein CU044_4025 [Streptomyces sp. L-9-10]
MTPSTSGRRGRGESPNGSAVPEGIIPSVPHTQADVGIGGTRPQ